MIYCMLINNKIMRKLLVIDDEENMLSPLNDFFTNNGFLVATLSRARAAYNLIEAFKPDVILLDIKLDELDGRDMCMELKGNNRLKRIKIILCSGKVLNKEEYINYGADDFIAKPFTLKSLLEKVNYHSAATIRS